MKEIDIMITHVVEDKENTCMKLVCVRLDGSGSVNEHTISLDKYNPESKEYEKDAETALKKSEWVLEKFGVEYKDLPKISKFKTKGYVNNEGGLHLADYLMVNFQKPSDFDFTSGGQNGVVHSIKYWGENTQLIIEIPMQEDDPLYDTDNDHKKYIGINHSYVSNYLKDLEPAKIAELEAMTGTKVSKIDQAKVSKKLQQVTDIFGADIGYVKEDGSLGISENIIGTKVLVGVYKNGTNLCSQILKTVK